MTEKDKMLAGELYNAQNPDIIRELRETHRLIRKFNRTEPGTPEYDDYLRELFPHLASALKPQGPHRPGLHPDPASEENVPSRVNTETDGKLSRFCGQSSADGLSPWIETPFYCDFGNIRFGKSVFINFNCVILDEAPVRIGDNSLFGPNVQIYTAGHPLNRDQRVALLETAKPVTIGNDCWLGGGVIVCPGVTIGDRVVVGAGSVVTKDIPADSVVAGNPAKPLK